MIRVRLGSHAGELEGTQELTGRAESKRHLSISQVAFSTALRVSTSTEPSQTLAVRGFRRQVTIETAGSGGRAGGGEMRPKFPDPP